jgi:hypothetical protein
MELVPGLELRVARLGDLIALKLLAVRDPGREHDWRDLRSLVAVARSIDFDRARASISLLEARGAVAAGALEATLEELRRPA